MAYQLIHHGAARGVTGSCHELRLGADGVFQDSLLVDCGLVQGGGEGAGGAGRVSGPCRGAGWAPWC